MDSFQSAYSQHGPLFWLAAMVLLLLLGIGLLAEHRRARKFEARLDALLGDVSETNTARMLAEYLSTVRGTSATVARVKQEHEQVVGIMPTVIRHVGLVRFSPFHDTGGDQSFALALLDGHQDGVVLTGLHSRNDSRLYAKPIERGSSDYSLTLEERQAMDRALKHDGVAARS